MNGALLTELRRSNAAGIHNSKPPRGYLKRTAIEKELDMTDMTILMNKTDSASLDDIEEPTDADLLAVELEGDDDLYNLDDEDYEDFYPYSDDDDEDEDLLDDLD